MTFKKALILTLLTVLQFSCSEFLKGKPKKDDTVTVSKQSVSCMNEVSDKLKNFLDSSADEKEIDKAFACVDSTMNEFQTRVDGKVDPNSFTVDELQKVLDKFVTGTKIPTEATKDLLALKAALLGGSSDKITKKEISDLRKYLEIVKVEAKALMPYVQLFKFKKEDTPFSKKMLQDGFGQLNISLKNLFKASQFYRSDYQFADLEKLITHLKVLNSDQSHLMSLAGLMKNLLGGNQALQSESDYLKFIDNFTDVLRLYSCHLQGYVQFAIEKPEVFEDTIDYMDELISLFENSLQFQRTKMISVESLDPLISEVSQRGLFPIDIKTETLLAFYKLLIVRAFDAGPTADASAFTGLTKTHLIRMRRELAIFKLYANMLSQLKITKPMLVKEVQGKARQFDPKTIAWLNKMDGESKKLILAAFEEFRNEFISANPVIYHANKMIITTNQNQWKQTWQDLARALYVKTLARELILGWGHSSNKLMDGSFLTEAQLVQWYGDFKQFGIEVKTFDPRSVNSGAVSFKQANLLTYSGNGDDKMNFIETVQYLNMLTSGGGQMTRDIQKGFEAAKCQLSDKDVFDNNWIDEKCAIHDMRQNQGQYFSNLPIMSAYISSLSDEQFLEFYNKAMDVSRVNPGMKGSRLETADLRNLLILFHYIESLYLAFDTDKDWKLSDAEIRAAYPRFKAFSHRYADEHARAQIAEFNGFLAQYIGRYSCYSEEDLIRESFVFLVFNGKAPQSSDLNNVPCLGLYQRPLIHFDGKVDRMRMINTFKILKSVIGS